MTKVYFIPTSIITSTTCSHRWMTAWGDANIPVMRRRNRNIESGLVELTRESTKAAARMSWKGALALGLVLFLFLGVLLPYGIETWSEARTLASQHTSAGRIAGPAFHQLLIFRAITPLKVLGAFAGFVCLVIATWKLARELIENR